MFPAFRSDVCLRSEPFPLFCPPFLQPSGYFVAVFQVAPAATAGYMELPPGSTSAIVSPDGAAQAVGYMDVMADDEEEDV